MRSEFQFIRNIKDKYGLSRVGDDCAVLPQNARKDLVVTADLLVEDIDFRLEWTRPEFLGHKALTVSLSDIAAMSESETARALCPRNSGRVHSSLKSMSSTSRSAVMMRSLRAS